MALVCSAILMTEVVLILAGRLLAAFSIPNVEKACLDVPSQCRPQFEND